MKSLRIMFFFRISVLRFSSPMVLSTHDCKLSQDIRSLNEMKNGNLLKAIEELEDGQK